jgi:hypothetical protein
MVRHHLALHKIEIPRTEVGIVQAQPTRSAVENFRIPLTAISGLFKSSLQGTPDDTSRIPLTAVSGLFKSSLQGTPEILPESEGSHRRSL